MNLLDTIGNDRLKVKRLREKQVADRYEYEKCLVITDRLLERAEKTLKAKQGKFLCDENVYTSPLDMVRQAEEILAECEKGVFRFKGRFAEVDGIAGDHAILEKDDRIHLIYSRGAATKTWAEAPSDNFGHAVSRDLKSWEIQKTVMQCIENTWEDFQVWAPHILYYNNEYWMFYTGVNRNVAQAIGLARSKDLYHWERYGGNPIVKPGEWGQWDAEFWSDCRDPMVLYDGGIFYMYYCARLKGYGEYCVGIASSGDLYEWKDEGYIILEESTETPPESPFAVKKDGRYYLFYTDYKAGTVYAESDHPVKGWKDAPKEKRVVIPGVSASEILYYNDKWYISYISHFPNQLHFFEIRRLIWNKDGGFEVCSEY